MEGYEIERIVKKIREKGGLTHEEEIKYFTKLKEKRNQGIPLEEIEERTLLIQLNEKLIYFVLKSKFNFNTNGYDEYFSAGKFGLIKAIDHFDVDKGTKFSTSACIFIYNEILIEFRRGSKKSVVPESCMVYFSDIANNNNDGDEDILYEDVIGEEDDSFEEILRECVIENIFKYFVFLNENEQKAIIYRYGLLGHRQMKLEELAKVLGKRHNLCSYYLKIACQKLNILLRLEELVTLEEKMLYYKFTSQRYPLVEEITSYNNKITI